MLRLILVRHAKSAWDDPALADFDRPLARRGEKAARWIGRTLREFGYPIDAIRCSPGVRARQTLELAAGPEGIAGPVSIDERLYAHRDDDYVSLLPAGGAARTLLLVGHNPATAETLALLAGQNRGGEIVDLAAGYPTGGIAVLEFDAADWAAVRPGTGRLVRFLRPPRD